MKYIIKNTDEQVLTTFNSEYSFRGNENITHDGIRYNLVGRVNEHAGLITVGYGNYNGTIIEFYGVKCG
jgi:hypothetical protein